MVISSKLREDLIRRIAEAEHPREQAVDLMTELQKHFGYMSDEAMHLAAELLGMTPLELEELATFYDYIYRQPVGKFVIHVCDSTICWMNGYESLRDYLCRTLDVDLGGTTKDGLFTVLPTCCLGYCDHSPAMLVNRVIYGELTLEKVDSVLKRLREEALAAPKSDGKSP